MSKQAREGVVVLGAGGHAKVVLSTLLACGFRIEALYDDDVGKLGHLLLGNSVQGTLEQIGQRGAHKAICAVGKNLSRQQVVARLPGASWVTLVHPQSFVHPSARLGPGTVVFAGVVIQPDVHIGSHVIVNTGASIDHDCVVESFVHIAPGCRLAGTVHVGEGSLLGIGSVFVPGVRIGPWSTVGAGAVVVRDLGAHVTAFGVPARPRAKEPA